MKRSEINAIIKESASFLTKMNFALPAWASWTEEDFQREKENCAELFDAGLGWDITDFGQGDFLNKGLVLITIRNGVPEKSNKTYAEKIMIVRECQETPMHYHYHKMEDIINRGGGNLAFELYNSERDGSFSDKPVNVSIDGIHHTFKPGEIIVLNPGMSLTLEQGMYHKFYAQRGSPMVMIGEVSMVNDDYADNRFYEDIGRFPKIEEDDPPYRLLVGDYKMRLGLLSQQS